MSALTIAPGLNTSMSTTSMLSASIEIAGNRPLLFNRFGPDAIPLTPRERTGVAGNDPEEWKRRRCWTDSGQLFVEPATVFACLRDGGKFVKKGRGTLQSVIVATLQVMDPIVLIDRFLPQGVVPTDPASPVYLDQRGVRMKQGTWNVRYRLAASAGWRAAFVISFDKTVVSRDEVHAACLGAGTYVGIGDGRKIGFGRFQVERFEIG